MSEDIPKIIHKVLLLKEGRFEISKATLKHHQRWLDMNPGYRLMYWDFQKCRLFLAKIHSDFLNTFDSIVPYSGKVDFFRYSILYFIGGWYSDWNQIPLCSISDMVGNNTDKDFYYFEDYGLDYTRQMGYAQTCFIGGVPNNIVMRDAIKFCTDHVQNEVYGNLPIDSTACGVITKAIHRNRGVSSSLGYFTRVKAHECESGLPVLISRSLDDIAIIHKICKTMHDENTWTNGNNYTAHWRTKTYYKSSTKSIRDKCYSEEINTPSESERVLVSLYAGEGLYFALRDELMSLSTEDALPSVLITYYDPDSYIDRWRIHLLTKLTKAVHFNGPSEGSFSKLPYPASKEFIRSPHLVADAFDEKHDGCLDRISNALRAAMNLKYEPTGVLFLMRKGRVLDSLTGKPVEVLLNQLSINYAYPEELSMELLMDRLRKTACLIAVHGDYLANMVFVSPSCSVLEITTEQSGEEKRKEACWHNMARGLGLPYAELPCDLVTEEGVHIDVPMMFAIIRERVLVRSNIH